MKHEIKLKNLVFTLIILNLLHSFDCKKKIKYTLNYDSGVVICNDEDSRNFMAPEKIRSFRFNESVGVLDGSFEFKKKIDGLMKLKMTVEKVLGNGKELVATHEVMDFCKQVKEKNVKSLYSPYFSVINFPVECPVEPATYTIDNMVAETSAFPVNSMMEGAYVVTMNFVKYEMVGSGLMASTKDTKLGCITFQMRIEPEG